MPRSARIAPGGMIFHVLNRANGRADLFDDSGDYAAFEKCLAQTLDLVPGVSLLCYCLMPNHWHLVLRPHGDDDLGRFMQRLTVMHVRRWHEHRHSTGRGHLYQGTYKSFPVQADTRARSSDGGERHFLTLCRYVERNALRAGLVRRAENWRWSSLRLRTAPPAPAADIIVPTLTPWPVPVPSDWLTIVNRPQRATEVHDLEQCLKRGRPLGETDWQQRIAVKLGLEHTFRQRGRPRKPPGVTAKS
jgi:putative transposase